MRRLGAVGVTVAILVLAACGGDNDAVGPTATVPQPTTTTDPYAVPNVIDEAYVNRVLAGLDHAVGEVARLIVRERAISQEVVDRMKALYIGDFLTLSVASLETDLRNGLPTYRSDPGDQKTAIARLISTSPSCIFLEGTRDYSAVTNRPVETPTKVWVAMKPATAEAKASRLNPTHWMFTFDGYNLDGTQPEDPCAAP